jgi:5'-deoxynucleotidase YfbR-like HD superfamily hydrolase/nucleoside phosphorylase
MNTSESIDVLILIALSEEARVFHRDGFHPLREQPSLESFPYHSFEYIDSGNHWRKGILVIAGEVGPKIRDAAILFAQRFSPKLVLNVGISGRIKDARVGDVVAPTFLNVIDYRSAAQDDDEGGYTFLAGGKPALVSSVVSSVVNSVSFQDANKLSDIFSYAIEQGLKLTALEIKKLKEWQEKDALAKTPTVVPGPFAISNMLIKSDRFKEFVLKKQDRNYVAADMESGLIADGLTSLSEPPPFYAIRAISDPATTQKAEYDAVGNGVIRQWAMANARQTVSLLLSEPRLFGAEQASLAKANSVLSGDYRSDYPGQRIVGSIQSTDFNDRFANLELNVSTSRSSIKTPAPVKFSEFANSISQKLRNGKFLVQGRGGGGKSAALKAIQLTLSAMPLPPETVFLNVRKVCTEGKVSSIKAALRERIDRDAPTLLSSNKNVVVFMDELYGYDDEQPVFDEIHALLSIHQPTLVLAFGLDHYEVISVANDYNKQPYLYDMSFDQIVDLKAISIHDDQPALAVIAGIMKTSGSDISESPENVLAALRSLGFPYLNHFVVSIYLSNVGKVAFSKFENNTQFVLRSMENLYSEVFGRTQDPPFNYLCVEALRSYCRDLARPKTTPERKKIQDRYSSTFAHFPRIVQTAFIAQAVVFILGEYNKNGGAIFKSLRIEERSFLSLVFANDVNNAVKDLLGDPRVEDAVLSSAKKIMGTLEPPGLSYALYLFGRARSGKGKRQAKAAFEDIAPHLADPATMPREEQSKKFWRLARRSLYISRSLSEDREATDSYISYVLTDPYEDGLNRSFHLEYYRDHNGTGMTVELELEDKGESWGRTRRILGGRIQKAVKDGTNVEYDRICVLTYFSLVRYRHELGKLAQTEREHELKLASELLKSKLNLGDQLRAFLVMVENALSKDRYSSIDAIIELFALKTIPRIGWVERNIGPKGDVVESVASHVLGAMLLAELLVDRIMPPVTPDERNQVIRLLLYHDLAEAYIGDYKSNDGEAKSKEGPAIQRIAALATYSLLPRLSEVAVQWKRFEFATDADRCGILARDFDKLDAVFQAFFYRDRFPSSDNRRQFISDNKDRISTLLLREIAEEIFRRTEQPSS